MPYNNVLSSAISESSIMPINQVKYLFKNHRTLPILDMLFFNLSMSES